MTSKSKIIIVGSGPSLLELKPESILDSGAHVIAVNGAIDWLGKAHSWFTLDPSDENVYRMKHCISDVDYYAAIDQRSWDKIPPHVKKLKRLSNAPIKHPIFRNSPLYWFRRWGCKEGLSEDENCINTGNSVYGALGLAYHWRPKKILILGLDGSKNNRVTRDGPSKRSLVHLPVLFGSAVEQLLREKISIVNGSRHSTVTCFRRSTPKQGLKWIKN